MSAASTTGLTPTPFVVISFKKSDQQVAQIQELYKNGRDLYGKSFMESRNALLGSLYLQLTAINFIPQTIDVVNADTDFTGVDHILTTSNKISLLERVQLNNFTAEQRLFLAETLRWLGHCYQNIPAFKPVNEENNARFEFLYGAAEELLKLDDSETTHLELAELFYNTGFFMYLRKNPEDYLGACGTYDKALKYNSSSAMLGRVENMRTILQEKAGITLTSEGYKTKVLDPYIALPEAEKDPFLVAMYHNNYASYLLKESEPDTAKIDQALSHTSAYMEKAERGEAPLHAYFGGFYTNIAKLRIMQNDIPAAQEALQKGMMHAQRNA